MRDPGVESSTTVYEPPVLMGMSWPELPLTVIPEPFVIVLPVSTPIASCDAAALIPHLTSWPLVVAATLHARPMVFDVWLGMTSPLSRMKGMLMFEGALCATVGSTLLLAVFKAV